MGGRSVQLNLTLEEGRVLDQALEIIIKRPDIANIIYAELKQDVELITMVAKRVKEAYIHEGVSRKG